MNHQEPRSHKSAVLALMGRPAVLGLALAYSTPRLGERSAFLRLNQQGHAGTSLRVDATISLRPEAQRSGNEYWVV